MQAILLAAGKSSRFKPFVSLPHKSAYTLMGKMLIEWTIDSIKKSGIGEIVIVVSPDSSLMEKLGDGSKYGVSIQYVIQNDATGMGDALLAARDVLQDSFFLVNAYHMDFHEFKDEMEQKKDSGVVMLLRKAQDVTMYGAVKIENDKIVEIVEKPETSPQNLYRLIGIYLLNKEFVSKLSETQSHEYHFEQALGEFIKQSDNSYVITEKETVSLKYSWNLLGMKNYLLKNVESHVDVKAEVKQNVLMEGAVVVEESAKIYEGAIIKGPAYIGKNVVVGNYTLLRGGVILEEGSRVGAFSEVKNSVVGAYSTLDAGIVLDSVLGQSVKIGAGVCTANVRLDRENVTVEHKGQSVDTGLHSLGAIIGDNAKLGVRVSTMPGITIGENSFVGPATVVMKHVPANQKYYVKFEPVIRDAS